MISEESLFPVQDSLITRTCFSVEQNKEAWKMEREQTIAKDPSMVEGLVKGWQANQVEVRQEISFAMSILLHV